MKINFNSDDGLSHTLKIYDVGIVIRSVNTNDKQYPEVFLFKCLHELTK